MKCKCCDKKCAIQWNFQGSVNIYKQLKKCAAIGWAILLDGLFLIELHEFNIFVWKCKKICLIFNKYFTNVLKGLKIQQADKLNPLKINKTIGSKKMSW